MTPAVKSALWKALLAALMAGVLAYLREYPVEKERWLKEKHS
jgi:hypothetical protein